MNCNSLNPLARRPEKLLRRGAVVFNITPNNFKLPVAILLPVAVSLAACGATTSATSKATSKTTSTTASTNAPTTTSSTIPSLVPTVPKISIVQSPQISGPVILRGNGIGNAAFGQPETTAIANLRKVLGSPTTPAPRRTTNCTVDSYIKFLGLTADFNKGRFVGYSTGSLLGMNRQILNSETTRGLRIGDALAKAKQIYGANLRTSFAQGGSWFASTPSGTIAGITTVPINRTNPPPIISYISAGSVGCPAVSP